MVDKLVCPKCGAEINSRLGACVKAYGYYEKDGAFWENEFGETIEYFCYECGETIPEALADKFFEETQKHYCVNCGKPVEEPDASYCDECFRKGEL